MVYPMPPSIDNKLPASDDFKGTRENGWIQNNFEVMCNGARALRRCITILQKRMKSCARITSTLLTLLIRLIQKHSTIQFDRWHLLDKQRRQFSSHDDLFHMENKTHFNLNGWFICLEPNSVCDDAYDDNLLQHSPSNWCAAIDKCFSLPLNLNESSHVHFIRWTMTLCLRSSNFYRFI